MSQVFLTVLDTSPVTINDLGQVTFNVGVSNLALIQPSGEFESQDVFESTDLITQENLGNISLTDASGSPITDEDELTGGAVRDSNAIHHDAPSEISTIVNKVDLVSGDLLIGEDSENSFNKISIDIDNLKAGSVSATIPGVWKFDDTFVISDPGSGKFRVDAAIPSNITEIAIHEETEKDFDFSTIFSSFGAGTKIFIQEIKDSSRFLLLTLTSAGTDNGLWWSFDVTVDDNGLVLENNEKCAFFFLSAPSAVGDVTAAAVIADNAIVRGDGGAKGVQTSTWTITDDGFMEGTLSRVGYALMINNTLLTGGGNGLEISAGETAGDILLHLSDADGSFNVLEVEADQGFVILGDTYANTLANNSVVYGLDNQHNGDTADINTQNGNYRIAGEIVPISAHLYEADLLNSPTGTDWAVNDFASLGADTNNAALRVRRFDDTTDEGVGLMVHPPINATSIIIKVISRAETAPGSAQTIVFDIYEREVPDNGAITAWSSATNFGTIDIPTNELFQFDSATFTLAALGLTAGSLHQLEFVRAGGAVGDTLVGDWTLLKLVIEFI